MTARAINTVTLPEDTVREAVEYIAANLREADAAEIRATVGADEDPFWAIVESWFASTVSWLIIDGEGLPIGIFGVSPHAAMKVGIVWLIGTPDLEKAGIRVARETRKYVAEMQDIYPILSATVDERNDTSLRWLIWAGFTLIDVDPLYGPEGRPFYHLIRTP